MARHHKIWARQARVRLLIELGNRCAECDSTQDLTFDCKISQGHIHHSMDPSARMCFYHRQHADRNLQILCRRCNGRKGAVEMARWQKEVESHPF